MAITTYLLSREVHVENGTWIRSTRPCPRGSQSLVFHSTLLCALEAEASLLVAVGLHDPIPPSAFLPQSTFHEAVLVLPPLGDNGF